MKNKDIKRYLLENVSKELRGQLSFFSATSKTKEEFIDKIWAYDYQDSNNTVTEIKEVFKNRKIDEIRGVCATI